MQVHTATLVDWAFDSHDAVQYVKGDVVNIIYDEADRKHYKDVNLADKHQRKLVWVKTLGGRWVFDFNRAAASNTQIRIFFCKDCGQPFDKFTELGNHSKSAGHNEYAKIAERTKVENEDEAEEAALQAKLAEEAAVDTQVVILK